MAQWYDWARQTAIAANISLGELDWFVQEVTGLDRLSLKLETFKTRPRIPLTDFGQPPLERLTDLWQRRLQARVPVQYLVGVTAWRNFRLKVSPAVLIPRPETECLIEIALKAVQESPIKELNRGHWVDLGTGSGAIALGLAEALPDAILHAVDCSAEALAIASENALNLGFAPRIQFYQGSWWTPLEAVKGQLSGMVSNPPYIPSDEIPHLQSEVVQHEPLVALDGGKDGLECIRYLIETAPVYLRPGGIWLIEMMVGQAESVLNELHQSKQYENIQIFPDLAEINRFVLAYRSFS